jgi:hypothetical protein
MDKRFVEGTVRATMENGWVSIGAGSGDTVVAQEDDRDIR